MKKILVSDLIGTLVPVDSESLNYLYGDGESLDIDNAKDEKNLDKAFQKLAMQINPFLASGNELNIVTCIDSHMTPEFLLQAFIQRIYQNLRSNQDGVHFYFQTQEMEYVIKRLNKYGSITEENNGVKLKTSDNFEVTFLSDKKEVFDYLKVLGPMLYTTGDSHSDLGMLTRSLSLGGHADFINYGLYKEAPSFEDILTSILSREDRILVERIALERYPNFFLLSKEERDSILFQIQSEVITNNHVYTQRLKLYDAAFAGQIDLNHENITNAVYHIIDLYNLINGRSFPKKDIIPSSICYHMGMYPTFADYYQRVLKK